MAATESNWPSEKWCSLPSVTTSSSAQSAATQSPAAPTRRSLARAALSAAQQATTSASQTRAAGSCAWSPIRTDGNRCPNQFSTPDTAS